MCCTCGVHVHVCTVNLNARQTLSSHFINIINKCIFHIIVNNSTQNWAYCMRTMNPTGKFNLLQRITNFDVGNVHADIITRARHLLLTTSHDRLMAVSLSAAAFYSWVRICRY